MNKLIALLLAAVMVIGTMIPGMAEPSPGKLDTQAVSIEISEDIQAQLDAEDKAIAVKKANPASYKNSTVASLVSKVNGVSNAAATTVDAEGNKSETAISTETTKNADGSETTVTTITTTESDGTVTTTQETTEDSDGVTAVKDVAASLAELPANSGLKLEETEAGTTELTFKNADGAEETIVLDEYDFVSDFNEVSVSDDAGVVYDEAGLISEITITLRDDALTDLGSESDLSNYMVMLINPVIGELRFLPLEKDGNGNVIVKLPFAGVFAIIQKV